MVREPPEQYKSVEPEEPQIAGGRALPTGPERCGQVYPFAHGTHWLADDKPDVVAAIVPAGQFRPLVDPMTQYWPIGHAALQ